MAGYVIYSLDWPKFTALVERPTPPQLAALAKSLADEREELDGEFDEDDPVLEWPEDAKSLAPVVAERLARADWYGDLSDAGRQLWETAFYVTCMRSRKLDVGFRVDSDGVYWDVINLIVTQLGDRPETPGRSAMSRFGTVPFRCSPPAKRRSVAPAIEAAKDPDVREQFTQDLLPAVERVAADGRLLFIQVDT